MKKNLYFGRKASPFILCIALAVAMALCTAGCNGSSAPSGAATEGKAQEDEHVLGTGSTEFTFQAVDLEGKEEEFEIHTDKKTVGEALQDVGLIEGEESGYGLYVKTVNGATLDFDEDGAYWAFYVNGEYAQTGVDSTDVTAGDTYAFKAEKQ